MYLSNFLVNEIENPDIRSVERFLNRKKIIDKVEKSSLDMIIYVGYRLSTNDYLNDYRVEFNYLCCFVIEN